jgi:hypothetical protein
LDQQLKVETKSVERFDEAVDDFWKTIYREIVNKQL